MNHQIFTHSAGLTGQRPLSDDQIQEVRKQNKLSRIAWDNPVKIQYPDLPAAIKKVIHETFPDHQIRYENDSLVFEGLNWENKALLIKIPLDAENQKIFHDILEKTYQEMLRRYDEKEKAAKDIAQHENDCQEKEREEHDWFVHQQQLRRRDQTLRAERKKRPKRQFTSHEESRLIHCCQWSETDLTRSIDNLIKKKTPLLKEDKKLGEGIIKLNEELQSFENQLPELEAKLDKDLTESEFKDVTGKVDYINSKITRIHGKLDFKQGEQETIRMQIADIDNQASVLRLALDGHNLKRELYNWKLRRHRVLQRIDKLLKDRQKLEQLGEGINEKWLEATGHKERLCPPVGLKHDSRFYFV